MVKKRPVLWVVFCLFLAICSGSTAATDVTELGLKGNGTTDCTDALQKALKEGPSHLFFPAGTYLLGTVKVPGGRHLTFAPGSQVRVNRDRVVPEKYTYQNNEQSVRAPFVLTGDDILVEGLELDCEGGEVGPTILFFAEGCSGLQFKNLRLINPLGGETSLADLKGRRFRHKTKGNPGLAVLYKCQDIEVSGCRGFNIGHLVYTLHCENVSVHGNHVEVGGTVTTFGAGSRGLRHYDNWSRKVTYQCVFRGGSPDPSRKAPRVPLGSSTVVERNVGPEDEGYNRHTAGTYDIQITDNYAEYGRTLAWGNKSRQILFEGNIARFMNDYAYGVEGCENVVFANNISINSVTAGVVTMYWESKVLITGNLILVRDEPYLQEYSDFDSQRPYQGNFIRCHYGPRTKKDTEAGSRYGVGKVVITGNLCVNELTDKPRAFSMPARGEVFIDGNMLINGLIGSGGSCATITNNEIVNSLGWESMAISAHGGGEHYVKNNVVRYDEDLHLPSRLEIKMPVGLPRKEEDSGPNVNPETLFTKKREKNEVGENLIGEIEEKVAPIENVDGERGAAGEHAEKGVLGAKEAAKRLAEDRRRRKREEQREAQRKAEERRKARAKGEPAIRSRVGTFCLVEGNVVRGYRKGIEIRVRSRDTDRPRPLILRDNISSGSMTLTGEPEELAIRFIDNLHLPDLEELSLDFKAAEE